MQPRRLYARPDGGVDWLDPYQGAGESYGYAEFYSSVEALLLGSRTCEVSLRLGEWPAPDKASSLSLLEARTCPSGLVTALLWPAGAGFLYSRCSDISRFAT